MCTPYPLRIRGFKKNMRYACTLIYQVVLKTLSIESAKNKQNRNNQKVKKYGLHGIN